MDFLTPTRVKELLEREGIILRKGRGQNMMIDRHSRDKILSFADLHRDDVVVEVGSGLGCLTEVLVEKVARVYAFEIDASFCRILRERFERCDRLIILEKDFLKTGPGWWQSLPGKVKLISNTPYCLSNKIVSYLLDYLSYISLGLLTVQKEVGERLVAGCGSKDYAPLSVFLALSAKASICYCLARSVFFPRPQVDSVVVKIEPFPGSLVPEDKKRQFQEFVGQIFRYRRKKLSRVIEALFGVKRDFLERYLKQANFSPTARAEELPPEEIYRVFLIVKSQKKILDEKEEVC